MKAKGLLIDEQTHPLILLRLMVKHHKLEWVGEQPWPASVVRRTLEGDFGVEMPEVNVHKLMAAGTVATRDEFWEDWEHFHFLVQALSNNIPDPATHHELSVGQMMAAVDIATKIREELRSLATMPTFNEEVGRYAAAQALEAGVWFLPGPLSFANKFSAGESYRCRDCGTHSEVLFDDHLCDICIERFDVSSLGSWTPNQELIDKGWGRNVEIFEKNPTDKVKARLEKVLSSNVTLQETQTDVCVAKLVVALNFVGYRREQLQQQAA